MLKRPLLDKVTPAALADMERFHSGRLGKAVRALEAAGHEVHYIEIGGYFSKWRERLAIKLWSGWPLYPQVFVKGTLVGGRDRTVAAIADGTIKKLLAGETVSEATA